MTDLRMGIYRHYKGALYQVLGLAHDANAEDLIARDPSSGHFWVSGAESIAAEPLGERIGVVYIPLELDPAHLGPRLSFRTLDDFAAWVCGEQAHDAYGRVTTTGSCLVHRFEYLGTELTAEMLQAVSSCRD